jgi:hypothetical protein
MNFTQEQLTNAFDQTDYKPENWESLIYDTMLKFVVGYSPGGTAKTVCVRLGLLERAGESKYKLTPIGRHYIYNKAKTHENNGTN